MEGWQVAAVPPTLRLRRTVEIQGLRISVRLLVAGIGWSIVVLLALAVGAALLRTVQVCGLGLALTAVWLDGRWAGRRTPRLLTLARRVLRRPARLAWRREVVRLAVVDAPTGPVVVPRWRQEVTDGA